MNKHGTTICKCGCGVSFKKTRPHHRFYSDKCRWEYFKKHSKKFKGKNEKD